MSKTKNAALHKAERKQEVDIVHQRLRRLNKRLALVYGLQAIFILFFASLQLYPVTIATQHLFDVSNLQLVALSMAISGSFHVMQATVVRSQYQAMLKRRENPYRWLENAFSTSLLPIAIGLVVGLSDITTLIVLFALGFISQVLAWQFEQQLATGRSSEIKRTLLLIKVTGLTVWSAVGAYMVYGMAGDGLSAYFVAAFVVATAAAGGLVWILQKHQQDSGKWHDYARTDRAIAVLNFTVKSAVAWLLLTGTVVNHG